MKWREPWAVSIKQQPRFNLLSRDVLKSALVCGAMFAGSLIVVGLVEDFSIQLERASRILWIAPAFGVLVTVFYYAINWLSPRKIYSGRLGIVIEKGTEHSIIPWRVIEHYAFVRCDGFDVLRLTDKVGDSLELFLSEKVNSHEVERELLEKTREHPDIP